MPDVDLIESVEPAAVDDICLVHDRNYVQRLLSPKSEKAIMLDPDTVFSPSTGKAAVTAAGAVIKAVNLVFGRSNYRAFCAVRPPGHHAERDRAMGFCIFNNIAIGAAYAIARRLAGRVAIIDWDVHHGNGTQNAFYDRSDVLFISLHRYPYYPGTGSAFEKGVGSGSGFTVNLPMTPGSGDEDYRRAFEETILPLLGDYRPDLIMISAGFDCHADDPLGGMGLTSGFFGEMTAMLVGFAADRCAGRIVSVLEGGYNLSSLAESVGFHLRALADG